jgi:hypothetical protein
MTRVSQYLMSLLAEHPFVHLSLQRATLYSLASDGVVKRRHKGIGNSVTSKVSDRRVRGRNEPETLSDKKNEFLNRISPLSHFESDWHGWEGRGGFVGNFTSKEKKDYLCSHVTDSGSENIMHFHLEAREFREPYTTGFQEFMNIQYFHSPFISLSIYSLLSLSLTHSLLDLRFSRQKPADISTESTASFYTVPWHVFAAWFLDLVFDPEDGDLTFLRNVSKILADYTASRFQTWSALTLHTDVSEGLLFQLLT